MEERWIEVDGFPGYEVSDHGSVRSIDRIIERTGWTSLRVKGRVLAQHRDRRGYPMVALYNRGYRKFIRVHRLVALAFIQNPEHKRTVNHIDGDKSNNNLNNLEWATDSENIIHAVKNGLMVFTMGAEKYNSRAVYMLDDDLNILKRYECIRDAERDTGAPNQNISKACKGKLNRVCGHKWMYVGDYVAKRESVFIN